MSSLSCALLMAMTCAGSIGCWRPIHSGTARTCAPAHPHAHAQMHKCAFTTSLSHARTHASTHGNTHGNTRAHENTHGNTEALHAVPL
jgi:hypothetical protein